MSILHGDDRLQAASLTQTAFSEPSAHLPTEADSESRARIIVAVALIVLAIACLCFKLIYPFNVRWSLTAMLLYPFGLLAILVLERLCPAVPTQKTLSTGLVHDALWVLIEAAAVVLLVSWYSRLLYAAYAKHLSFLTLPVVAALSAPVALAIGAVVLDLTRWCQHWLHHHVSWLWPFHAVHHAQRELNLFSDYRIHFMEFLVRRPVSVLPMLMLGLQAPEITWWLLLLAWHARLYHANIRSHFGLLRYVIVTPQSHRVHHSRDPRHLNHNYGAMLSVWDYLFGTQYRQYDVYPETGIDDEKFPIENAQSISSMLTSPLRQMSYPFQQVWMLWRRG